VFFHDEGELYVAPTGGGEALVSALFDYRHFRRDGITHLLSKTWALRDRVSRLEFTTPVLASAPLGLHVPKIADQEAGLLLVGDAAGASDPITASGLALALVATRAAAEAIISGDLSRYEQRRRALERPAHQLGVLMRWLGRSERRATRVLKYTPAIIEPLLASLVTPCRV
jgi:flavin-dependent dehydrogenase